MFAQTLQNSALLRFISVRYAFYMALPALYADYAVAHCAAERQPDGHAATNASPIASAQAWLRSAEQGVRASAAARSPLSRTPSAQKLAAEAEDESAANSAWDATYPASGGASLRVKVVDTAAGAQAARNAIAWSQQMAVNCRISDGGLSLVQACVAGCRLPSSSHRQHDAMLRPTTVDHPSPIRFTATMCYSGGSFWERRWRAGLAFRHNVFPVRPGRG